MAVPMITSWSHNVQRRKKDLLKREKILPRMTCHPSLLGLNWITMPTHETVPGLYEGTIVEESKTEKWESKVTQAFKAKRLGYIGRGEVVGGKMMIFVIVLLIWDAKEVSRWKWSARENMDWSSERRSQLGIYTGCHLWRENKLSHEIAKGEEEWGGYTTQPWRMR